MRFCPLAAAAYLAAMVDGEGNIGYYPVRNNRRLVITNTDIGLLKVAADCCQTLGLPCKILARCQSKKRPGDSRCYDLLLRGGRVTYERFAQLVPIQSVSKREALTKLIGSYRRPAGRTKT